MKESYEREKLFFFLICSVKQIYLCHERQTVQVCWIEVSAVQRDLHLSQEGVAAEATMMPHWDQDRATEQLGAVEGVLWDDEDDDGGSGLVINTVISWTQPLKKQSLSNRSLHPSNFLGGRLSPCRGSMLRYETKTNIWQSCFNLLCKHQSRGLRGCGHCLRQARQFNRTRRTEKRHHLQSLVVDGVDRVPLDAGLPFALARFVGQQIAFDIAGKQTYVRRNPAPGKVASVLAELSAWTQWEGVNNWFPAKLQLQPLGCHYWDSVNTNISDRSCIHISVHADWVLFSPQTTTIFAVWTFNVVSAQCGCALLRRSHASCRAVVATQVFLHLRVGKVPRSVAVRQPVALLDEHLQAARDIVVAETEGDVSAHLHGVKVSCFTVNAHEAAQRALQKYENTPLSITKSQLRFAIIVENLP